MRLPLMRDYTNKHICIVLWGHDFIYCFMFNAVPGRSFSISSEHIIYVLLYVLYWIGLFKLTGCINIGGGCAMAR